MYRRYIKSNPKHIWFAILLLICATYFAWSLRWVCDDAFISFRYAKNFVLGEGLVYNQGEYVEGYTNFLWTMLMTIPLLAQWDIVIFSEFLSILFYVCGCIGMLYSFKERDVQWFPFLCWIAIYHVSVFATSGLETSMFLCCIIWIYRMIEIQNAVWVVVLGLLLCLTRPEGALFALGAVLLFDNKKKVVMNLIFPLIVYGAWKLFYYGNLLPNTFYAKGTENRWSQGILYMALFFYIYWPLIPIFVWTIVELYKNRSKSLYRYVAVCLGVFILHVIRVGGDFMFARFVLPILPFLLFIAHQAIFIRYSSHPKKQILITISIVCSLLLCRPTPDLESFEDGVVGIQGITEERFWYPNSVVEQAKFEGEQLQIIFEGTDTRVVILGMQAMLAYYGDIPYVLEGMNGLTDFELARHKSELVRVGHGQRLSASYMQERNIDMFLHFRIQQSTHPLFHIQLTPNLSGQLFLFRRPFLETIQNRGVQFWDMDDFLDQVLQQDNASTYLETQGISISYLQKYYLRPENQIHPKYIDLFQ